MPLQHLPADSRPREKLLSRGAAALSDAELLALLLRTGIQGKNVLLLAQEIVSHFGGVAGLLHANPQALKAIKGLGPAKQAELLAVMEMAKRSLQQSLQEKPVFATPQQMIDFLSLHIANKPHEVFAVMFLDVGQRLIAFEEMFRGTITKTSVYPREVAFRALELKASGIVLAHNHPSGSVQPSAQDISLTQTMVAALKLLDITVFDHVIVSPSAALSMQSELML